MPHTPEAPGDTLVDTLREGALTVVRTLRDAGFQALFAGGSVRDRVLGLAPKDYDVATDAAPEAVLALFPHAIPVGVQFGVVRVVLAHHQYEVATFRAEADYSDGRRPGTVRWADAEADVLRRDFTINGLLEDPLAGGGGEVLDFVGGRADLAARLIRAIGVPEERFAEDALRLLRCVRFAARMQFDVDEATWRAVVALAPTIVRVSPERIGDELDKILSQGHQARGLALLHAAALDRLVLPELAGDAAHGDAHARLRHLHPCDATLGWSVALLGLAPAVIEALGARLRWSRQRLRDVIETTSGAGAVATWPALSVAERKRAARKPTFALALIAAASAGAGVHAAAARAELAHWSHEALRPAPLLTGEDLKRAGHRPGPAFRDALDALEAAQLEGRAATVDEAWAVVAPFFAPAAPSS